MMLVLLPVVIPAATAPHGPLTSGDLRLLLALAIFGAMVAPEHDDDGEERP